MKGMLRFTPKQVTITGCVAVLLAIAALVWAFRPIAPTDTGNPITASLSKQVGFTLYYPDAAADVTYVHQSLTTQNNSITFTLSLKNTGRILVTEQSAGQTVDGLTKSQQFTTPIGPAYLATASGTTTGVISAQTTTIVVNPVGQTSDADLSQVMQQFRPVR